MTSSGRCPVLLMLRPTARGLAASLSNVINSIVNGSGFTFFDGNGNPRTISLCPNSGTIGDIAVLCSSPQENGKGGSEKLPGLLRANLENLPEPINVYNPRGQPLEQVREVQQICGLVLECIDPGRRVQDSMHLPAEVAEALNIWRDAARAYASTASSVSGKDLPGFVAAWQSRTPLGRMDWPDEVSLLQLIYKLVTWIPVLRDDIEGLVYLEALLRTVAQSGYSGRYNGSIYFDDGRRVNPRTVEETIRNILSPLAIGSVEINEDLLDTIPPDRLSIMSIHQAKSLEFPLVIIDIGSEFKTEHPFQRFKRFPEDGGKTCRMEDFLRPYSLSPRVGSRSSRDRAFDDIIRRFFVGFSRPQDVLLLVGLNESVNGYCLKGGQRKEIPNIATGWTRDGRCRSSLLNSAVRI